jgi:hypothetical protein
MDAGQLLFVACIFLFSGCQKQIPQKGMWAGTMTIGEEKQLPFQMYLDVNSTASTGYFLNGAEQTSIPEIRFPSYFLNIMRP